MSANVAKKCKIIDTTRNNKVRLTIFFNYIKRNIIYL